MRIHQIKDWNDFIRIANALDIQNPLSMAYAFRGHANEGWELKSSFHRIVDPGSTSEAEALSLEGASISEFKSQAHIYLNSNEFSATTDPVSWLCVMQHHGAPTRLLDWTSSIYVAAYFAVSAEFDKDGSVILVHINSVDERVKKLHGNFSFPTTENEIRNQYMNVGAPNTLLFTARITKSSRMIAQQAFFSISRNICCKHQDVLNNLFSESEERLLYSKLIIPSTSKNTFLKKLRQMNITASSLYPGIDGLGKSISELLNISKP
jgi:hypothetical protein